MSDKDTIYRQDAIRDIHSMDVCVIYDDACSTEEAVEKAIVATKRNAIFGLECMPSVESEVIRCKDCKHWDGVDTCDVIDAPVWDNDFCSMAERRTDDKTNKSSSC